MAKDNPTPLHGLDEDAALRAILDGAATESS